MKLELKLLKDLTLTEGQSNALDMCKALAATRKPYPIIGRIRGYAGTGKTTMLRVLAEVVGDVTVITPTGKAALRVTEATGLDSSTIHRWIYKPKKNPRNDEVEWVMKAPEDIDAPGSRIITIDEASMVDEQLWNDVKDMASMLSCNILIVGDPFQLPPVVKRDGKQDIEPFSLVSPKFNVHMDVELTEVLRQALESPIIRASMMLRAGNWLDAIMELPRVSEADLFKEAERVQASGGVVIVHKNSSRHFMNKKIREMRGYEGPAKPGEPLMVLRNNYELNMFNGETAIFNGWDHLSDSTYDIYNNKTHTVEKSRFGRGLIDNDTQVGLCVREVSGELEQEWMGAIERIGGKVIAGRVPFLHANFGYTYTGHKSQGSEWPEVLVTMEPSIRLESTEGRKFAYTAITRASKSVKICYAPKIS